MKMQIAKLINKKFRAMHPRRGTMEAVKVHDTYHNGDEIVTECEFRSGEVIPTPHMHMESADFGEWKQEFHG